MVRASSRAINKIMPSAGKIEESLESFLNGEWEIDKERGGNRPAEDEQIVVNVDDSDLTMSVSYRGPEYQTDSILDLGYNREEIDLRDLESQELTGEIEKAYKENKARYRLDS